MCIWGFVPADAGAVAEALIAIGVLMRTAAATESRDRADFMRYPLFTCNSTCLTLSDFAVLTGLLWRTGET